jgi:NAD(P)-dependent dehydrogenase (short-subunit alcohol dehydrogenase family)
VALLDLQPERAEVWKPRLDSCGSPYLILPCNVLETESVRRAVDTVLERFGSIHALVNGAGGNSPQATTSSDLSFFDLPVESLRFVLDLNLLGTMIPSQIVGRHMAKRGDGVILNISSMNALRPLTRIPAYSAAKAGVSNFTQWLAVHMAQNYSPRIRVNAIAPGFFLTEQNRFLLTDRETGELTPRGQTIIAHTPAGRFGRPEDLTGAVVWLLSPAAEFVTGIVLPIDGGFQAFSGV